ncbi:Asp-tRNA(Asn)/Glu-tRNA(Gln) amidotransferase subunit GatC [Caldovatus aquaticus]|uniref:Aspartyl/glutamyl-tRNA(Asn/Gln) amidotransferase subunit C n=1 Tax=Caldovatus aquaticus TaxID=2865671 RepID=A0ABS7EXS7_9PROT|nr:Asp-tRNA(Asn)/Glu-tRNA(Gln) amidotransferase subunit GatC [Caldovatus aquaticus]MBW8268109.1 Asp-tRNA(Asn)/Glu-tRNA(Gln) amidotransferase subunit GatC [Caldovatus aquaticus]
MSLDTATVRRVAALARIRLEEAEVARLQAELNGILGWIEQLRSVDTEGVEPMAGGAPRGGPTRMPMREDVVTEGNIRELILANAPDREGDFFAVPKVVE